MVVVIFEYEKHESSEFLSVENFKGLVSDLLFSFAVLFFFLSKYTVQKRR